MAGRIDFKRLRQQLSMRELLAHYGIEYTQKGERARAHCPLPTHEAEESSPSFSADLSKGLWQCFGCGAKGNVLDFALRMEGYDPQDGKQLQAGSRHVAAQWQLEEVATSSGPSSNEKQGNKKAGKKKGSKSKKATPEPADRGSATPRKADASESGEERDVARADFGAEAEGGGAEKARRINPPLDFALKNLDPEHPYLATRGLTPATIEQFGLGYCARGMLKDRIAIPIHDGEGQLVGYAGRLVDDNAIDADHPKYRFPATRERQGVVHEFRKSELLFNAHHFEGLVSDLLVVEGFFDCLWLWQQGYTRVVALMGTDVSETQSSMLVSLTTSGGCIRLMPDGDEGGERCAAQALPKLATHRAVRWLQLEDGTDPTDLSTADLQAKLG